ncbi:MAG: GTPase Era [Synechococcus sp.]
MPPIPGLLPKAPKGFRSGFAALVGRPNVGKSTILNGLVGQKIAITSPIAQTTRNRLQGILTLPMAQIVLVDTPGIHKPHHRLGEALVNTARSALNSVDVVILVVDGSEMSGKGDRFIANWLSPDLPVILCRNKQDLLPAEKGKRKAIAASYKEMLPQAKDVSISALNKNSLEPLLGAIASSLPQGPYYYPPDLVTDRPERFIMGELIREQILHHTRNEVPHSVAITIDRVEESPKITRILATAIVERDSQKGILIGKGGQMLKTIGSGARQQIQKLIVGKVYLELFVKVRPKWRQSAGLLAELGYTEE